MISDWISCTVDIKEFVVDLLEGTKKMLGEENFIGFYLHGSLAIGGFNPHSSDIDILVVTKDNLSIASKIELANFFLKKSNQPYPIEISCLNQKQLSDWQHPSHFDFHYSEAWRERYENDLLSYINNQHFRDPDLAAHITILNNRGICIDGLPIKEVFPSIPLSDYISSILSDFNECLIDIEKNPVYCTLNLIRVYWYLKEGMISSKQEAGEWGLAILPKEFSPIVQIVTDIYKKGEIPVDLNNRRLLEFRDYINQQVQKLL